MLADDGVEMMEVYWVGGNGCEFMTWNGNHQVFIMPTWEYPNPPSQVIQYHKRVESYADFLDAINNGKYLNATYEVERESRGASAIESTE